MKENKLRWNRIVSVLLALSFVLALVPFVPQMTPAYAASTQSKIDQLDKEIAQYQKKIDANNKKKKKVQQSANAIQEEIDVYQGKINAVNRKIAVLDSEISSMTARINSLQKHQKELQASIQKQEDTIASTRDAMAQRMRAMYLSGNTSNLELLLEADSFAQLLNRIELIARMTKNDSDLINTLQEEIAGVQEEKKQMAKEEAEIQANRQEIESKKDIQEAAKADIVKDKAVVDAKKKVLDNQIDDINGDNADLQKKVAEARQQQQAFMNSLSATVSARGSTGSGQANGTMLWPVPYGDSYISSGYGNRTVNGYSSFHYGIDITRGGADQWTTQVIAADSGTIIIASNACSHNYRKSSSCGCNGGYGNYVVIDNGNGLQIYNAHLYKATVSVGQHVSAGQQIGILGCTGYSTGPHLHFEIRVNDGSSRSAAARNPLNYVSH